MITDLMLFVWSGFLIVGLVISHKTDRTLPMIFAPLLSLGVSSFEMWTHQHEVSELSVFFLFNLSLINVFITSMLRASQTTFEVKLAGTLTLLFTVWAYFSKDAWSFAAFWFLSTLPQLIHLKESRAKLIYVFHHLFSLLALALAIVLLEIGELKWTALTLESVTEGPMVQLGLVCLLLAVFIRQAFFPFHLWFKSSHLSKPFPLNIGFYHGQLGLFLFVQTLLPLVKMVNHEFLHWILLWGVVSALYFANMSLVQKRVRSSVFYVMLAQFSVLLCGLETKTSTGMAGMLFQFLALGLSFSGILACLYLIEWHRGVLRSGFFYGLQISNGTLGVLYLLFSLCAVAVPFSMGFAGEDLIFHAVIEESPFIGLGLIVTASINGMSLFRNYCTLFRGDAGGPFDDTIPLHFAQKVAFALILVVLFGFGLMPDWLLKPILTFL